MEAGSLRWKLLVLAAVMPLIGAVYSAPHKGDSATAHIYVTLWFDTEDFTSPEPDSIILPLCQILEKQRIRATFKIVGEKARDLERKGQKDVIKALSRHDIGFHTTYHSLPPAVTAYLDRLDWTEGVDEFARREEPGFNETKRIFKRTPICYGQPGSAWAPQVYGTLRRWGVPLYLDEGVHVGLKGQPFYYCGLLNVYDMADRSTRMNLEGASDYEKGTAAFRKVHDKLVEDGGGLVSIYYHPNEFDHTEFWDAVIWARGANPPRDRWQVPKKRTPESRAQALDYFSRYLEFMKSLPGVQFVAGTEMVKLYADKSAAHEFSGDEVASLAKSLSGEISFQRAGGFYVSAAEAFSILLRWHLRIPTVSSVRCIPGLLGPCRRETAEPGATVEKWEFLKACEDALETMTKFGRVPNMIWIGSVPVTPADFLATVAGEIVGASAGSSIQIRKGNLTLESFSAPDSTSLFSWIIFPKNFHAPHVMDLTMLQCWSLKPAQISR
jgi:hypothetical protein